MLINGVVLSCTVAIASSLVIGHSSTAPNTTLASHDSDLHGKDVVVPSKENTDAVMEDVVVEQLSWTGSKNAVIARHDAANNTKVKTSLSSGLILFFGCSLDIYAINDFCTAAHAPLIGFTNNFAYMAYCTMAAFTIVYVFQPGASAPPYWRDYVGTLTAQQIVAQSAKDIVVKFGREPTAIVVDSSLWDVSNWWQKASMPIEPYQVPVADIDRWCQTDLPLLLGWIQTNYPRTKIALRTPSPVLGSNTYGQSSLIVDAMVKCVRETKTDFLTNKVYGKYNLIDFHKLIQQFLLHQTATPLSFYKDVLHPGPQLSMVYMNAVLEWVRGFQTDPVVAR